MDWYGLGSGPTFTNPHGQAQIPPADETAGRLVERVVSRHVRRSRSRCRQMTNGGDIVSLEIFLDRFSIRSSLPARNRCPPKKSVNIVPAPSFDYVGGPDHPRERPFVELMQNRRAGLGELGDVQPGGFQRPTRRAVAAREPAPHILVRIDVQRKPALARFFHDGADVLNVILVILARAGMFDCFPGDKEPQEIKPPRPQAAQMLVRFFEREGPADKGNRPMIEKSLAAVGCAAWSEGNLRAAAEVDAAQD